MKIVKIMAALATLFLVALFTLIMSVENPEIALYEKTVQLLMQKEGVTSEKEAEERFPILIDIQTSMNKITKMNEFILNKTQNPAPILTEVEALQLIRYTQEIPKLREEIRRGLTQLMTTYEKVHP